MYRLRNRNKFPGELVWRDPGTGFQAQPFSSFDVQANGIQGARLGNPAMVKRYRLSTDLGTIENELDMALGQMAFERGMTDFYISGSGGVADPAPFPINRPRPKGVRKEVAEVVEGGTILINWLAKAEDAVPHELAESRASVCVKCPLNDKGDWLGFFTRPLAGAFRMALERRLKMNLSTSYDADLHVCSACSCVLKLKVHVPFEAFYPKMDDADKMALDENCWVRSEAVEKSVA